MPKSKGRAGGYKPSSKVIRIEFAEDTDFAGLWMRVKSMSTGKLLSLMSLAGRFTGKNLNDPDTQNSYTDEDVVAIKELFGAFSDALVEWNMLHPGEDRDEELPPTFEGVCELDITVILPLILEWIEALTGVDANLKETSPSGPPLAEAYIPMAPL